MASAAAKCAVRVVLLCFICAFVYLCYVVVQSNSPHYDSIDFHNEKITSTPSLPVISQLPPKPIDDLSIPDSAPSHKADETPKTASAPSPKKDSLNAIEEKPKEISPSVKTKDSTASAAEASTEHISTNTTSTSTRRSRRLRN